MKRISWWAVILLAIVGAGAVGYWLGHRNAGSAGKETTAEAGDDTAPAAEVKPVAIVGVAPLRRTSIADPFTAYGTVAAPPSEVRVVSVPFESRVMRVLVTPGQPVNAGQPLIEVTGSAATALALEEARNASVAAERDLQLVQQRYDQKLATNAELYTAQNAARTAQGRLRSLQEGGAGGARPLTTDTPGIVSKVDVQVGQVVAIGGPLVEVAAESRIEVRLAVEPEDAAFLKPGQPVQLTPVDDPTAAPVAGAVRLVGQRVDPTARRVDVVVSLPASSKLLLESFVAGRMTRAAAEDALVVPRDAALPNEEGGYELFTVKDGRAVRHAVRIGIENDRDVQVMADDLKEGDPVVVVGNYELEEGMSVRAQPAPAEPASPEPATTEPSSTEPAAAEPATVPAGTTRPAPQTEGTR